MTVLKALQFRTYPAIYTAGDMFQLVSIGGWADVPEGMNDFPAQTEFRIKPLTEYRLHEGPTYKSIRNKASLMEEISKKVDAGDTIQVSQAEVPTNAYTNPLLQVKKNNQWISISIGDKPVRLTYASTFRLRPDFYYRVTTIDNALVTGFIEFEDIEELAEYVDKRIRTDGMDFSVKKVKYV